MKKNIIIIILAFGMMTSVKAQLSVNAQALSISAPNVYSNIVKLSNHLYEEDTTKQINFINKQSDAQIKCSKIMLSDEKLMKLIMGLIDKSQVNVEGEDIINWVELLKLLKLNQ